MNRDSKGKFKKGHITWNKGLKGIHLSPKSEFKEGQNVGENHPSWKGGLQKNKSDCNYLWIDNKKRARRPRVVYEEHYGKIPSGFIIVHKDGDRYNDNPENLEAISRAENLRRNQKSKR